jgi:hypothetical protein
MASCRRETASIGEKDLPEFRCCSCPRSKAQRAHRENEKLEPFPEDTRRHMKREEREAAWRRNIRSYQPGFLE